MTEDDYARDALQRIRMQTKSATDSIGNKMADDIMNVWTQSEAFKQTIMPSMSKCPTFLYADIFDAMAKRLTERFQSELIWYSIESNKDDKDDKNDK